jgi:hypothetical protein
MSRKAMRILGNVAFCVWCDTRSSAICAYHLANPEFGFFANQHVQSAVRWRPLRARRTEEHSNRPASVFIRTYATVQNRSPVSSIARIRKMSDQAFQVAQSSPVPLKTFHTVKCFKSPSHARSLTNQSKPNACPPIRVNVPGRQPATQSPTRHPPVPCIFRRA